MDRRSFLGSAALAPMAVMAGHAEYGASGEVRSLPDLEGRIARMFECVDGPPVAYFEGVSPSGEFGRVIYTSLVNGVVKAEGEAVSGLGAAEKAVESLWYAFLGFSAGKSGRLYWRAKPELRVETVADQIKYLEHQWVQVSPGQFLTKEIVEDGLLSLYAKKTAADLGVTGDKFYARMRIAISDVRPFVEIESGDGALSVEPSGEVWRKVGRI